MNTTIQVALLDGIINTLLDGDTNTAIVGLLRMRRELTKAPKAPTYPAHGLTIAHESELPPMQPVNPGRKVKFKDVPCPLCKAKAGTECFEMANRGPNAAITSTRKPAGSSKHLARRALAADSNDGPPLRNAS